VCKVLTWRGWELQPGHTSCCSLPDVGNRSLPALLLWTPTTRSQPENNENGLSILYLSMCLYIYIGREKENRPTRIWNVWISCNIMAWPTMMRIWFNNRDSNAIKWAVHGEVDQSIKTNVSGCTALFSLGPNPGHWAASEKAWNPRGVDPIKP
jgi:hypothetical protein